MQADVADVAQVRACAAAVIAEFGRVDSLVNAAGLTARGTLLDTTPELFDAHIAVNLKAPFFLMQAVVADLVARKAPGTIVSIISTSAHAGQPYLAPYVAAKAGLAGLTRNAAHAHRWDRIRINGLNIGWTDTEGEDATQRRFHGADDDWRAKAGAVTADGQARAGRRDRRVRGVSAVGSLRRGHRLGDRLGPERAGRYGLMRIGLLGLGRIGAFHAETLAGLPAVEELVLSDPVPELAEQAAGRFGGRIAGSPEAVLASGVDGVVIAAPTRLHAELLDLCVAAGLPTFCEKPLAHDSREAVRLARRVADTDVQVQIGYPRRFDPAFAAARAAVADGDLGTVHTVRSTTLDPAPPPRAYLAASGGIFRDCAVHDYNAVRWVTGQEVIEVYAVGTNQDAEWFGELDDVHTASAVLTLDGGALAVVSNTRYNARGHDVRLEVHGTRDSLAAGLGPRLPLRSAEPGVSFPDGKPFTFFMDRLAEAFRTELTAFTEVVAGLRASPCTVLDALETGWVAEACTLSLREHRPVQIEEVRIS